VRTGGYLAVETGGAERLRVTATGEVVVQNQDLLGTPTVLRVLWGNGGTGATQVIIQAGANQAGVNLLEWWSNGATVLFGGIDGAGNLFVNTHTTLGDDPGDEVTVNAGTVKLLNIPPAAATDGVLRINTATGEVTRSTVAAIISAAGIIRGSYSIPFPPGGSSFNYHRPWQYPAGGDCDGDAGGTGRWDNLPAHGDQRCSRVNYG
jgi:hypothetical protein